MKRKEYWESPLRVYFEEVAQKKFEWGVHDCSLFAASAVEAMTGEDFGAPFRGQYSDAAGAALALRTFGAGTLEKTVSAIFGDPVHIAQVKRGDVVMYMGSLGICCGTFSRFVGAIDESGNPVTGENGELPSGLIPVPTFRCDKAWNVPF